MSWSASVTNISIDEIDSIVSFPAELSEEAKEQFEAAKEHAKALAESGVVGDVENHRFNVNLAGHANPGHEPAEGWANDGIAVNVAQSN